MTTAFTILPPARGGESCSLFAVHQGEIEAWLQSQPAAVAAWVRAHRFQGERHRLLTLPATSGSVAGAVFGLGPRGGALTVWDFASLPGRLPAGSWRVATPLPGREATQLVLGALLGSYQLDRYRATASPPRAELHAPEGADLSEAFAAAGACNFARELIDTPANDLGPAELAQVARELASAHSGAEVSIVSGDGLREAGYPLIHAVGMASVREPCLIDLAWGDPTAPRVTLAGKGVCFDSGGLDIKPPAGMLLMKKDMGGAACALGLARLLMELQSPIRLRVLVPAVENSVSGRAYRPGDVWRSRKGLTVEIGNTDAEGRLVLADALAEADAERPDLLVDLATLTGAARTALGPELPAAFGNREQSVVQLLRAGELESDPVWPMPLWAGYEEELGSRIADLSNVSSTSFAGSIIGALFLRRFVTASPDWLHLDLYAWNARERPGRPVGAEAQCVRALYRLIRDRFG